MQQLSGSFKLPDLTAEFEYWEDMEWLNNG